jgi:hypothetical protein
VAYANVSEIMNSQFRQRLHSMIPTGQGNKDELFGQLGIDVERDIHAVVAATAAGDPAANGLVLIRGIFDEGRIEALVRDHQGSVETYKGKRLLEMHVMNTGAGSQCVAFLEPGLAALGSAEMVKTAIDTHASHADVTKNADLMRLISELNGRGNTAWAVGSLDAVANNPNVPQQVRAQLPGVKWLAISAHVDNGVSGQVRAEAKDEKAAADLRAVVNGAIAAGHLMGGKDPNIEAFLNSLQLSGSGDDVDVNFVVPPEILNSLNGMGVKPHPSNAPTTH